MEFEEIVPDWAWRLEDLSEDDYDGMIYYHSCVVGEAWCRRMNIKDPETTFMFILSCEKCYNLSDDFVNSTFPRALKLRDVKNDFVKHWNEAHG